MRPIVFELCAETIDACLAARDGGANRIELCSGLSEDGLTPSHGLVRAAVQSSGLPIHTLIRPRGGNFLYSGQELAVMAADILHMKELGVAGVVLGLLNADDTVDIENTRALVQLARPLKVTFHRAFDATPSLSDALESIIAIGCDRVLTSGGERDVIAGASRLASLVRQSGDRIQIAAGGGLRLQNAASLARLSDATHFHGSLRHRISPVKAGQIDGKAIRSSSTNGNNYIVNANDIRAVILKLNCI